MSTSLCLEIRHDRLLALLARIDDHELPARFQFYSPPRPPAGAVATGSLIATMVLAKPCAIVVNDQLRWVIAGVEGQRMSNLDVSWVRCVNGAFAWRFDSGVTDLLGPGPIKLEKLDGNVGAFLKLVSGGFDELLVE